MSDCEHLQFNSSAGIHRLVDEVGLLTGFTADLRIWCRDCDLPFVWIGVPMGMSFNQPMSSIDGLEMRAPIAPSLDWQPPGRPPIVDGFRVSFTPGSNTNDS